MVSSLSLTSSMDLTPKFLMFRRSFSENSTSWRTEWMAHRVDTGALEAVVGADREVQVLDLLVELDVVLDGARGEDGGILDGLVLLSQAHERSHVLVDDVGSLDDGVTRGDGPVGLDLEDETVVVESTWMIPIGSFSRSLSSPET